MLAAFAPPLRAAPAYLLQSVGRPVAAVDTPALVLDTDAMDRNMHIMREYCAKQGVALRPHAKLHKSAEIACRQMTTGGACGVCVQKVSEAEALAAGGVGDIVVTNEIVAPAKLRRLVALAIAMRQASFDTVAASTQQRRTSGSIAVAVDSVEGVAALAAAADAVATEHGVEGSVIDVLVEVEVGQGRSGIAPGGAAVPIVRAVLDAPRLSFRGVHAYHGFAQHIRSYAERKDVIGRVVASAKATVDSLEAAGIQVPVVTGAGTGTFSLEARSGVYTELQPGSYMVMDRDYADNDDHEDHPPFEHAMFIVAQVMSKCSAAHSVIDAGHKAFAIDSGMPSVFAVRRAVAEALTAPLEDAVVRQWMECTNGGDEHGMLRWKDAAPAAVKDLPLPAVGDIVWLVPGHCDPTFNLHDFAVAAKGGFDSGVVDRLIRLDARGCTS